MASTHALAQLIHGVEQANGWNHSDVARQATKAGHALGRSNVSRLCNEPVVVLKASTVRTLAAGLRISEQLVIVASLRSMGLTIDAPKRTDAATAIREDPTIDARGRRMLLAMLSELTDNPDPRHHSPAPSHRVTTTGGVTARGLHSAASDIDPSVLKDRRNGERKSST